MRRPKRPTWVRVLRSTKLFVEHRVGISLGDALNIALFLLTLLSLAIGIIGTWVAIKAMRGADKQQATLDASRDALVDEAKMASQQLAIIKAQSSGGADVSLRVSCGPSFWEKGKPRPKSSYDFIRSKTRLILNGQTLPSMEFKARPAHGFWTDMSLATCYISLKNQGAITLTNAFVKIHFEAFGVGGFWPNKDGKQPGFMFKIWDPLAGGNDLDIQYSEISDERYIDVLKGRTVFPQSDEPVVADLELQIPSTITSFYIEYKFGGDQQPTSGFSDIMNIYRTDPKE